MTVGTSAESAGGPASGAVRAETGPARDASAADAATPDVERAVRAELAGATWFELARATSHAHHVVESERSTAHGATAHRARYAVLRAMLDEATAELSTHCLHARL